MGARAQGMGYASSCLSDAWGVLNNTGGLASVKHTTASFSYHAHPSSKNFNRMAAVIAIPTRVGVLGAAAFRFGDNLYNEQLVTGGFANKFGIASLGLRVNYLQYQAEGFGTARAFTVSMGGIANLTSQLSIGAHISNINQPKITHTGEGERVPTRLIAGIAFEPSEKLLLTTEIEKALDTDMIWKAGVEYQFHPKFIFRTGLNLNPQVAFMGFGFKPKRFRMDYAVGYQHILGLHHQATVTYQFVK